MRTSQVVRQERARLLDQANQIWHRHDGTGAEHTAEELRQFDELMGQVDALEAEAVELEAREARGARITEASRGASTGRVSTPISGRIDPVEAEADKTRSFGDFLKNVAMAGDPRTFNDAHERLEKVYGSTRNDWTTPERRALAQGSGITGGYTVPTQTVNTLMEVATEAAIVRPRAFILPMDVDEVEIPSLDQSTAPTAGNTQSFGGVVAGWTADLEDKPETEPKFSQAKITAHELSGYTEVGRSLIQNSAISIDALLLRLFGLAIGWYEDLAFLLGNGVGKPLGVGNAPALVKTAARGSATAITFKNARSVWTRIPQASRAKAVWLASQNAEETLLDMTGTANSVFVPSGVYVAGTNPNGAAQPINYMLLNRPVLVSEKLPALNSLGDFGCYDFSQYVIGDRRQLEVAVSEHFKFRGNKLAYRFIHKVGGMPWLRAPITLPDTSTKISPFVQLAPQ